MKYKYNFNYIIKQIAKAFKNNLYGYTKSNK